MFCFVFLQYILACSQLITLAIEVGKFRTGSKVKRDFLLKVPETNTQSKIKQYLFTGFNYNNSLIV